MYLDFENVLFVFVHVSEHSKLYTYPNLTLCCYSCKTTSHDIVAHGFMSVLTSAFSKHNRAEKVNHLAWGNTPNRVKQLYGCV